MKASLGHIGRPIIKKKKNGGKLHVKLEHFFSSERPAAIRLLSSCQLARLARFHDPGHCLLPQRQGSLSSASSALEDFVDLEIGS